jgi:hypothetical protein
MTATILKPHVLGVFIEDNESEVVVNRAESGVHADTQTRYRRWCTKRRRRTPDGQGALVPHGPPSSRKYLLDESCLLRASGRRGPAISQNALPLIADSGGGCG